MFDFGDFVVKMYKAIVGIVAANDYFSPKAWFWVGSIANGLEHLFGLI